MNEMVAALSTSNPHSIGWSDAEIETARISTIREGERIRSIDGIFQKRDVHIKAEPYEFGQMGPEQPPYSDPSSTTITKIIHFQRHAQGYHNVIGEILLDNGVMPSLDTHDTAINPWRRPEVLDSPLTELGKQESFVRRNQASMLNPQLVVVSPMQRAIQTAKITFADHDNNPYIPWIAHEGCREELGFIYCNKRRSKTSIQQDFPTIDLSLLAHEDDILFDDDNRECPSSIATRAYDFLVNFIAQRPEQEIAIISHSFWLFNVCTVLLDGGEEEKGADGTDTNELLSWFKTAEIRSMKLTFTYTTNNNIGNDGYFQQNKQEQSTPWTSQEQSTPWSSQQQQSTPSASQQQQVAYPNYKFAPKNLYVKKSIKRANFDEMSLTRNRPLRVSVTETRIPFFIDGEPNHMYVKRRLSNDFDTDDKKYIEERRRNVSSNAPPPPQDIASNENYNTEETQPNASNIAQEGFRNVADINYKGPSAASPADTEANSQKTNAARPKQLYVKRTLLRGDN